MPNIMIFKIQFICFHGGFDFRTIEKIQKGQKYKREKSFHSVQGGAPVYALRFNGLSPKNRIYFNVKTKSCLFSKY